MGNTQDETDQSQNSGRWENFWWPWIEQRSVPAVHTHVKRSTLFNILQDMQTHQQKLHFEITMS